MSQFNIYRSTDTSAPILNGTTGSVLTVFDACLVNGYGSQPAAGWTKPFPNTGACTGCYQPLSGSKLNLVVLDDGVSFSTSLAKMVGFETLTNAATGTNQFGIYGSASTQNIRKSSTTDATARSWIMFADAYTFYFFNKSTELGNSYLGHSFGDFYSMVGTGDLYRTVLIANTYQQGGLSTSSFTFDLGDYVSSSVGGHYTPRNSQGVYTTVNGINMNKHGDIAKGASETVMQGSISYPNTADNGLYLSPVWIAEPSSTNSVIRGKLRGIYHVLSPASNFTDQQTFNGVGDFVGKSFMILKPTPSTCVYCVEISNTLDTNI